MATNDEAVMHRVLKKVLVASANFDLQETPPAMAQTIHRIVREETGVVDPYAEIKAESTRVALELAKTATQMLTSAVDPFGLAVRFSIAGNIMDFALTSKWDSMNLETFLQEAAEKKLDESELEDLRRSVEKAESILLIGDNAGEAVFDRLLMEQVPNKKWVYAVKSSPIINDATMKEAKESGIDSVATLIENGNDAPGTILSICSEEFLQIFNQADLVIAKGQANYETLSDAPRDLFFLTQIKCFVIAKDLGKPLKSWVVQQHKI